MRNKKILPLLTLIFLFSFFGFSSYSRENAVSAQIGILEKIEVSRSQNILEVKIFLNRSTIIKHFRLSGPERIIIDFSDIEDIKAPCHLIVNDFGISSIRAGMFMPDIARVVFDVADRVPFYEIEKNPEGIRALFWLEETAREQVPEKIQDEIAIGAIKVNPVKANPNIPIIVDMGASQNARSMEVEVFDSGGTKIAVQKLTPQSSTWETRFAKPGEYTIKGRAFNSKGKPSVNPCESKISINSPPVCKLESPSYEDYVGKLFVFDASGSTDFDGETVKAEFEVTDEKGNVVDKFTATKKPFVWKKAFEKEGIYTIPAVVSDDFGAMSEPSQVQVVVKYKRIFYIAEGGFLFAKGSPDAGYGTARIGVLYNIVPGTFDFTISAGGGQAMISDPWKSFLTTNFLFNVHAGPVFLGAGSGITTKIREDRNPDGELIADAGFELTGKNLSRRSFYFEIRAPVGKGRNFAEHHKLMAGLRFVF